MYIQTQEQYWTVPL